MLAACFLLLASAACGDGDRPKPARDPAGSRGSAALKPSTEAQAIGVLQQLYIEGAGQSALARQMLQFGAAGAEALLDLSDMVNPPAARHIQVVLSRSGEEDVVAPVLFSRLQDEGATAASRIMSIRVLASTRFRRPRTTRLQSALRAAMGSAPQVVRLELIASLPDLQAVHPMSAGTLHRLIARATRDESAEIRLFGVVALGSMPTSVATKETTIDPLLADPDPELRAALAIALAYHASANQRVGAWLEELASDPMTLVSNAAWIGILDRVPSADAIKICRRAVAKEQWDTARSLRRVLRTEVGVLSITGPLLDAFAGWAPRLERDIQIALATQATDLMRWKAGAALLEPAITSLCDDMSQWDDARAALWEAALRTAAALPPRERSALIHRILELRPAAPGWAREALRALR